MSPEDNENNLKNINTPKPISAKQGCLRGLGLGCGVVLLALVITAIVVYFRIDNFFKFGIRYNLENLQKKVNVERTLTDAQYYEVSNYLRSITVYMMDQGRSKEALINYSKVNKVFQKALRDERLTREELAEIRGVMLETDIPVLKQPAPKKNNSDNNRQKPKEELSQ